MPPMSSPILATVPLERQWPTLDPFLFCVHHLDAYPPGNANLGIDGPSLSGRSLGSDFSAKDGWSMYHGTEVPGFPRHPHRGFETVTLARQGFIDHSDSLGARARFGNGDVQWMTAGHGIEHSEMFPLVHQDASNPTELFQIWLNLPEANKHAEPHFKMMWKGSIPSRVLHNGEQPIVTVTCVAGDLAGEPPPSPPPCSWASQPESEVVIATFAFTGNGEWSLPPARGLVTRVLYFFRGETLAINGRSLAVGHAAQLDPSQPAQLRAASEGEALVLQGLPIGEPVVQRGPFVMNDEAGIRRAFADYQRDRFGRWQWDQNEPVHPREAGRFAVHADGREERLPK